MKLSLVIPLLLLLIINPAFGQLLSDQTGLVNRFDVEAGGHIFEVKIVSNFDVIEHEFDDTKKRLSFFILSNLENNLGEIIIPANLLSGNFTFYLDGEEYFPKVNSNAKISFITLNFTGSGDSKLDIFGTVYLDGLTERDDPEQNIQLTMQKDDSFVTPLVLWALTGSLIAAVAAAYAMMKIKKRRHG